VLFKRIFKPEVSSIPSINQRVKTAGPRRQEISAKHNRLIKDYQTEGQGPSVKKSTRKFKVDDINIERLDKSESYLQD
jgi:hypothetical protein